MREIENMNRSRLLYTSADIHRRIKQLFGQPSADDRRVALVAYVGADGEKYLRHPKGLRLICNPSAGGTDPDTLRQLLKRGTTVEISDRLHMKVYWSKNRGCIITSANASSNALGKGGVKEAGIWLPSGAVDINRLIRYSNPRKLCEADLRRLDRESREEKKNTRGQYRVRRPASDFDHWYSAPHRPIWKIACVGVEVIGTAKVAKEQSYSEYGHKEPHAWTSCRKNTVRKNDWALTFVGTERGAKSVDWLYCDFVVKVSPRERRYYYSGFPCHAVQVNSPSKYPLPPFKISPRFRKALSAAVRNYTPDRIIGAATDVPSERLLKLIAREYTREH